LADSDIEGEIMRKFTLLVALSAGALFMTVVAVPNQADAMTFSNPIGVLDAVGTADDVARPEQVRWCRWPGCRYQPRSYYYYSGWYRPWPVYPQYNFGTGASS
jgi:hypothetical protein